LGQRLVARPLTGPRAYHDAVPVSRQLGRHGDPPAGQLLWVYRFTRAPEVAGGPWRHALVAVFCGLRPGFTEALL
ncbi:MAG: hypothetical protein ACK559_32325, partial [bacterium]